MTTTVPNIVNSLTGSTLDIQKLATDLVAAVRAPQQAALDTKMTKEQAIVSSVGKIVSAASSLQTGLQSYGDPRLLAYTPVADTNATFTFHPSSPARAVDFSFQVNQVATTNSVAMAGITDDALSQSTGTLNLYSASDGTTLLASFPLTDGSGNRVYSTVGDLQAAIKDKTGFDASLVSGTGSPPVQYLTISHGTGLANRFSVKMENVTAGTTAWQPSSGASVSGLTDSFLSRQQGQFNIYAQGNLTTPLLSIDLTAVDAAGNRVYKTLSDVQAAINKDSRFAATISTAGGETALNVSSATGASLSLAVQAYVAPTSGFTASSVAGDTVVMSGIKDSNFPPGSGQLKIYGDSATTPLVSFDFTVGADGAPPYPSLESLKAAINTAGLGLSATIQSGGGTPPTRFLTINKGTNASATISAKLENASSVDVSGWQAISGPNTKVMTPVADSFFKTAVGVLNIYPGDPKSSASPLASIDLNATDTQGHKLYNSLSDVQAAINNISGLNAAITTSGSLKSLSISSGSGSDPITVSFDPPPATDVGGLSFAPTATSRGMDASVTVGSNTFTSANNTFSNLVSDLIINIKPTTSTNPPPTVHLTTQSNSDQCKQILGDIVTAYNTLMNTINTEIKYDADIKKRGGLNNNSIATSFLWQMRDLTTTYIPVSATKSVTLADVGVSTNQDGTLTLDQTKLASVISSSPGLLESVLSSSVANSDIPSLNLKKGAAIKGALQRMTEMASVIVDPTSAFNGLSTTAQKTDIPKIQAAETKLDDDMTALQAKYLQQFSAMQTAVQQSKNTQDSLTQSMSSWSAGLKG